MTPSTKGEAALISLGDRCNTDAEIQAIGGKVRAHRRSPLQNWNWSA
jgi:hypothetical protein